MTHQQALYLDVPELIQPKAEGIYFEDKLNQEKITAIITYEQKTKHSWRHCRVIYVCEWLLPQQSAGS